jgi:hypothetical protein
LKTKKIKIALKLNAITENLKNNTPLIKIK